MSDRWYKAVGPRAALTQGDIITDCHLVSWMPQPVRMRRDGTSASLKGALQEIAADVIVMTQACDLAHGKVDDVIVCPHLALSDLKSQWEQARLDSNQAPTQRAWQSYCADIKDGYFWNLAMLNAGASQGLEIEHRVVDFHNIHTLPKSFLESLLRRRNLKRLQLLPPYREHVSQAFARYFMRVGLPSEVRRVW